MKSSPVKITILSGFRNQGYDVVRGFLSDEEVEIVLRAVETLPDSKWFRETDNPKRHQVLLNLANNLNASPAPFRLVDEPLIEFASRMHHVWYVEKM